MSNGVPSVPAEAVDRIIEETRTFGRRVLETGGFLLLPRDAPTVSLVAFAGAVGIARGRDLFEISERALDRLFVFADDHDLWAPIQFHSHRLGAFLSRTDMEHGLCAEGFISVVVPTYAAPPDSVTQWGWWRFESGAWVAIGPCAVGTGEINVVEFGEVGVRDR